MEEHFRRHVVGRLFSLGGPFGAVEILPLPSFPPALVLDVDSGGEVSEFDHCFWSSILFVHI
jgi:hypothetical protein